jgi:hypothetical protein
MDRQMKPRVSLILPIAALFVGVLASDSQAGHSGPVAPVILSASPRGDSSDTTGGGFLRVTFSPDGDQRADAVSIRVRSTPGDVVVLAMHPDSNPVSVNVSGVALPSGVGTLAWDGLEDNGKPRAPGSYVLTVCSKTTNLCAAARVLAHLRFLSLSAPVAQGVSAGQSIRVALETDLAGPTTIDLVPASNPHAQGVGAQAVAAPGSTSYSIPVVAGGLWLLRATNGRTITYFPLVVHEARLPLDTPPSGTALVVYPYITWRAYDRADLDRDGEVDTWYAHPRRPVISRTGRYEQVRREVARSGREASPENQQAFALWLQQHQLVAQHVTDIELGRMSQAVLQRYAVIVFPGHTEYYERATYDHLLTYRNSGGRLYFLSGNSFYGEVAVGASHITRLSYRYRTPARSDFRIASTGFRSCCWPASMTPRYHLAANVRERLPWLLDGTDLKAGDPFGAAGGEVDTLDPTLSPPGTMAIASATVPRYTRPGRAYAFGWLGTQRFTYEPSGVRPRRVSVAYAATGRGEVFSWGNTRFVLSLEDKSLPVGERAALDRVALNVWRRFTRPSAPHADRVVAAAAGPATFTPSAGHRLAGFALDRESLALAEDPTMAGGCPVVRLVSATGGTPRALTRAGGPTCSFGGSFLVRRNGRAVGVAIVRALWVVRNGARAIVVKASPIERENVLARGDAGALGPVVATNWLRLFAQGNDVVSGNRRTLWTSDARIASLGLDDKEHAVSAGARGAISMWHAHGARYGNVADAHAAAVAMDGGVVAVLRSDRPQLDVRRLSGRRIASWPVARGAAPLLDVDGGVAVYIAAGAVHELLLASGRDSVVARAPAGTTLLDAQIEPHVVAYAVRGGSAGPGRVVVIPR